MAVQKSKTSMASVLGNRFREAALAHQHDEVELDGFGSLPEGIENGVAQVKMCKFDLFKEGDFKGKYYFMAQAVVVSPEYVEVTNPKTKETHKIKVAGKYTKIGPEPVCDTPKRSRKTMEEHIAWVQNQMKAMGADPDAVGPDDLESTAAAIAESQPYITFRTWKGKPSEAFPNPRVQETWGGTCEFTDTSTPADQTQDDSGGEAKHETNGAVAEKQTEAESPQEEFNEFEDMETLVQQAEDGDESAREKLQQLAIANGATPKQVEAAETWQDVADLAKVKEEKEEKEEKKEAPVEPAVGKMYKFQPLDPKTGKPFLNKFKKPKPPMECEVTAVSKKNKTVDLKSADDESVHKAVPWAALS